MATKLLPASGVVMLFTFLIAWAPLRILGATG
jgi:hypothetical protein